MSAAESQRIPQRIGFLGSGAMAEALALGLIKRGLINADQIACNDPNPARKELFKSFGANPYDSNIDVSALGLRSPNAFKRPTLGATFRGRGVPGIGKGLAASAQQQEGGPGPGTPRHDGHCLLGSSTSASPTGTIQRHTFGPRFQD